MPTLSIKAVEKWSKSPIPNVAVYVNDTYAGKTNEKGEISVDMTNGSVMIKAKRDGYEDHAQSLVLASNAVVTVMMKPIVRAL